MCGTCQDVLEGLERIDGETDELDINFVKINDPKYAKKYGVSKLPALVYFRKKFPSIYRGENRVFKKVSTLLLKIFSTALLTYSFPFFADNLLNETEVLTWLRINRYKRIELNWIMYMVLLVALAFLSYSAFIIYGLQPKEPELKKED